MANAGICQVTGQNIGGMQVVLRMTADQFQILGKGRITPASMRAAALFDSTVFAGIESLNRSMAAGPRPGFAVIEDFDGDSAIRDS